MASERVETIYPVSFLQEGLLFHALMEPARGLYIAQATCRVAGSPDLQRFREAWQAVVARHQVLRAGFTSSARGRFLHVIHRRVALPWEEHDWSDVQSSEESARLQEFLAADRDRGFELNQPPLMRLTLLRLRNQRYQLVWTFHHVLFDGWSMQLILQEVLTIYHASRSGVSQPLPAVRPFADYIAWLQAHKPEEAESYWRRRLAGFAAATQLQVSRPPAVESGAPFGRVSHDLGAAATGTLRASAQRHHVTLNTMIEAAWAVTLGRYSNADDVIFGVAVSGRPPELTGVEQMVGLFINTIPFRVTLAGDDLGTWLRQLQQQQAQSIEHAHAPLVDIHGWSDLPRAQPLFTSLLVFANYPPARVAPGAAGDFVLEAAQTIEQTHYELLLQVAAADSLELVLTFDRRRFTRETAAGMLERIVGALLHIADGAAGCVDDLVAPPAMARAPHASPRPAATARTAKTDVVARLESETARRPDAVAIVDGDLHLSYAELAARSGRLAGWLRARGVGAESRVAVCVERSARLVVAVVGVLRSGALYVPLDPQSPPERLNMLLEQTRPVAVVTSRALAPICADVDAPTYCVDDETANGSEPTDRRFTTFPEIRPEQLAYMIFTSGTTGRPKGVMVTHDNVARLLGSTERLFASGPADVWALFFSIAFDFSVWEMWGALAYGGRLVVVRSEVARSAEALHDLLARERVTVLNQTPSAFYALQDADRYRGQRLAPRLVIFGGEALVPSRLQPWMTRYGRTAPRFVNMYGITETTVHVTWADVDAARAASPASIIGEPIDDLTVCVLDRANRPLPDDVAGELYVGGPGVSRGYWNAPALTAQRFVPDPFGPSGSRLYRSGDLARYTTDGVLEYLGRNDRQLKVRGFRIEPGEIESVLCAHPAVADAVVVAHGDDAQARLVAHWVAHLDGEASSAELKRFLADRLPEHMVPAAFARRDAIPRTVNGKVDRAVLISDGAVERAIDSDYEAPQSGVEAEIARIWSDVLRVPRVGAADSFFELGGHSLTAMQAVARVRHALDVAVSVVQLFDGPTVREFARAVQALLRAGRADDRPPLLPRRADEPAPASFGQQRLWFLQRLEPASAAYNIGFVVRIAGPLNRPAFEAAVAAVANRHEVLRTRLRGDRDPVQVVDGDPQMQVREVAAADGVPAVVRETIDAPFRLEDGHPIRLTLIVRGPDEHLLVGALHHSATDAWSMGIWIKDLATAYRALDAGEPIPWIPLPVQYGDYAAWQRGWLRGAQLEREIEYWRQQLSGSPTLTLPTDRPRPEALSGHGAEVPVRWGALLTTRLHQWAQGNGATMFMALLATWTAVLARHSGQSDVCVGTPVGGRTEPATELLMGFFVNTLALRIGVPAVATGRSLLRHVREIALGAYAHQDVPFDRVVTALQAERDLARNPLFQVLFAVQNAPEPTVASIAGLRFEMMPLEQRTAHMDLELSVWETPEGLQGTLCYDTDLFDRSSVEQMWTHWERVTTAVLADPNRRLADIELVTGAERAALLERWAVTPPVTEAGAPTVIERFEQQARAHPDRIALVDDRTQLTYATLNARSDDVARRLRSRGVQAETLVAVGIGRSSDLVVAILGILKAGAAYVPIDPDYPEERISFVLEDTGAEWLVTETARLDAWPTLRVARLAIDEIEEPGSSAPSAIESPKAGALAYIIYTSGSTGRPKGVMVTHGHLSRLLTSTAPWFGFDHTDTWTLFHSIAFDFSVWELWGALTSGGRLLVVPAGVNRIADAFHALVARERVTVLNQTPSAFAAFDAVDDRDGRRLALRHVIFGGEAFYPSRLRGWRRRHGDRAPIFANMYGITETTVHVTYVRITDEHIGSAASVIGERIPDLRLYVLDAVGELVPARVAGELCVGGAGVARGYWRRPALTAERFVPDPFGPPGSRMYRSGDLARHRADGMLEFIGRADAQIKVRGFRIEPGEIEAILRSHPAVRDAVVIAEAAADSPRLVAFYVPGNGASGADGAALRGFLAERLPDYMLPAFYVPIDEVPLTSNGKLDRGRLPSIGYADVRTAARYVTPRDRTELEVAAVWAEQLRITPPSVTADFFEVGGDSFTAMSLASALGRRFAIGVPVAALFQHRTIERLAAYLRQQGHHQLGPLVPINESGTRTPCFCVHPVGGHVFGYLELAARLGEDQPFYGLQFPGIDDAAYRVDSVETLAGRYLEAIIEARPAGPYHFAGWSFGGLVAYEMACQAVRAGACVETVTLFDTAPPDSTEPDRLVDMDDAEALARVYGRYLFSEEDADAPPLPDGSAEQRLASLVDMAQRHGKIPADFDVAWARRAASSVRQLFAMQRPYRPPRYPGHLQLFRPGRDEAGEQDAARAYGWESFAAGVTVARVPGTHATMLTRDGAAAIARILNAHQTALSIEGSRS